MEKGISRRDFLAGVGAAGALAGLGLAGCAPQTPASAEKESLSSTGSGNVPAAWDEECDVLVLGGGGAGSSAALAAAQDGVKVIVVESQTSTGFSSTAVCKGNYAVVGSDEMIAAGIEDSPELFVQDAIAYGADDDEIPGTREDIIRTYAENSRATYDILKELGVEFSEPYNYGGHSVDRIHKVDNAKMQQLLTEAAQEAGAEFMFNTEFTKLVSDGDGVVLGAIVEDGGKEIAIKANRGVCLTTGSFVRNGAMVDNCLPGLSKVALMSGAGATGKGHIAAMELGAPMWGLSKLYAGEGWNPAENANCELFHFGGIAVDRFGSRYIDEGVYWSNMRNRSLFSKGYDEENDCYLIWYVVDQTAYEAARAAGEAGTPSGLDASNDADLVKGDTIEALAEAIGAPNLPATLEKYNEDMASGVDTVFGRTTNSGEGSGTPFPLTTPPYYAWPNKPVLEYAPTTGFMANGDCQILDQYDEPIGGGRLFACGELIHRSIVGNHYLVGTSIGSCTTLGMVIGHKAAALDPIA